MEFWVKLVLCHFQPDHFPFLVTYRQWGRPGFDLWVGKIPWRRGWLPIPVFLPGELPWTEEPGRLWSMGSQRVRHDWATKPSTWEMSFPGGSNSEESACNAGDKGSIPELERSPGKRNGTHSSISAWRIPRRGDLGLPFMGSQRVGHDWATKTQHTPEK